MKIFIFQLLCLSVKASGSYNLSNDPKPEISLQALNDKTDIIPDELNCSLSNGQFLNAAIAEYVCSPLPPLLNGEIFCFDEWKIGTVCMGVCKNGWILEPHKRKKRCLPTRNRKERRTEESPVKWNFAKSNFKCVKDYQESPCSNNKGGCSHECIDKGDMIPICVCPCGHTLANDGKTCIDERKCPLDISLWLDGTTSACAKDGFNHAQKTMMANLVGFLDHESHNFDAKIFAASYGDGQVQQNASHFVTPLLHEIQEFLDALTISCANNSIADVFQKRRDQAFDSTTVSVITLAAELLDPSELIKMNRPRTDTTIVIVDRQRATKQALIQASILACNHENTQRCENIFNLNEVLSPGEILNRVSRESCFSRNYMSTISCGDFFMELDVPICSLRGLQQEDLILNAGKDGSCTPTLENNGTHYKWIIGYEDCGTKRTVDEKLEKITFTNNMRTWINRDAPVFPVLPEFNIDLECAVSTSFEFFSQGDFYPELSSFRGVANSIGSQTGNLQIYADPSFTETWDEKIMGTGVDLFVESNFTFVDASRELQVTDCVASSGELIDLVSVSDKPVLKMIEGGCLTDRTVKILPRGPRNQVRFQFKSFRFHGELSGAKINIQCKFKTCETKNCASIAKSNETESSGRFCEVDPYKANYYTTGTVIKKVNNFICYDPDFGRVYPVRASAKKASQDSSVRIVPLGTFRPSHRLSHAKKVRKNCSSSISYRPDSGWIEDESLTFPEEDNTGKGLSAYCAVSGEFGLVIIPGRTSSNRKIWRLHKNQWENIGLVPWTSFRGYARAVLFPYNEIMVLGGYSGDWKFTKFIFNEDFTSIEGEDLTHLPALKNWDDLSAMLVLEN
ncbi:Oidioi.mRNA.OKI2018_I69.chr2.g3965.t3.cds [Oikopleura dioica]|uniref:Oidioi.mRNA.OKI2018_I69.chr2.g3965.t3.cds n=1 Tax=Oikopleura dioica TaxID=34765 RepID=A0ABN7SVT5_OIKDI|nr:Oidioi.mRNA.OKI2018_I69.chr2.g3965.t3.cds [Oikopleura dioica]